MLGLTWWNPLLPTLAKTQSQDFHLGQGIQMVGSVSATGEGAGKRTPGTPECPESGSVPSK